MWSARNNNIAQLKLTKLLNKYKEQKNIAVIVYEVWECERGNLTNGYVFACWFL